MGFQRAIVTAKKMLFKYKATSRILTYPSLIQTDIVLSFAARVINRTGSTEAAYLLQHISLPGVTYISINLAPRLVSIAAKYTEGSCPMQP